MNQMIVSNLVHRPIRSLVSVIAVAVEVTLILLMVGLATGLLGDYKQRQEGIGGDVVVRPPNASWMMSLSSAAMPSKVGDVIRKQPHVAAAAPIVVQTNTGALGLIFGIDLASWEQLGGPFHYLSGGPFQKPDDLIVDEFDAADLKIKVGQTLTVLNHPFRVCGIVEQGRGARRFIPITTMQELNGSPNRVTAFFVKADNPANTKALIEEIKNAGMQNYSVISMQEYLSQFTVSKLPGLPYFISVVIGVAVVIGFLVIFQAMYTAVMERTREIGILKSLGASKGYIVNVILRETVLIAICGIIVGIAISLAARASIVGALPTLRIEVPRYWVLYAAVIAVVGAIGGALYPAFKAAQKDPIDALAYE